MNPVLICQILFLLALGPWLIWVGWKRYKQGVIPRDSYEYIYAIAWLNEFNRWLGRPRQRSLTPEQVRCWGTVYILGGVIDIPVAIFLLIQLLTRQ